MLADVLSVLVLAWITMYYSGFISWISNGVSKLYRTTMMYSKPAWDFFEVSSLIGDFVIQLIGGVYGAFRMVAIFVIEACKDPLSSFILITLAVSFALFGTFKFKFVLLIYSFQTEL